MSLLRVITRYIRWYHVVGLLLSLTALTGIVWWLMEHERGSSFRFGDETDLVERD
jgi:hypothetical protein